MRKVALLAASALLIPGVAFADGEEAAPMSPMFIGASVGWTSMEMPEHQNGAYTYNFGGGFVPLTQQADVDGVTYAFGIGKDLSSGWRVGAYARFFDGEGSASTAYAVPNATPFRYGTLAGLTQGSGNTGGASVGVHSLDVDVTEFAASVSAGHALGELLRADLIASYVTSDTENHADAFNSTFNEHGTENTSFNSSTYEFAARLGAGFPLSNDFSVNLGGSAGWGLRNIDMDARQRYFSGGGGVFSSSTRSDDKNFDGFIGRADAALNFAIARSTTIGITANYVYDDMIPVFVAPVYPAAGTGSAATFTTESHSSMTYGLRVIGRF